MDQGRTRLGTKNKKVKKVKKKKPIDNEAIELAAENKRKKRRNEIVTSLITKTDLSEEELFAAYDEFPEKYATGCISEKQFLQISKV